MPWYSDEIKESAFRIWYEHGKLTPGKLMNKMASLGEEIVPGEVTLRKWIPEWRERAAELDQEIKDQFNWRAIG